MGRNEKRLTSRISKRILENEHSVKEESGEEDCKGMNLKIEEERGNLEC